jgi:hypothetical protein
MVLQLPRAARYASGQRPALAHIGSHSDTSQRDNFAREQARCECGIETIRARKGRKHARIAMVAAGRVRSMQLSASRRREADDHVLDLELSKTCVQICHSLS